MLRFALALAVVGVALAGCADDTRTGTPTVFTPRCGEADAPAGAFETDVEQGPNRYNATLFGDDADGWSLKASIDAPRGSNATVVVEGDGGIFVAEAAPGEQPLPVEPLCSGEADFPLERRGDGRLLVTFLEPDADTRVRVPVALHVFEVQGGEVEHRRWSQPAWAGGFARATVPGHYLPDLAYTNLAGDGSEVRLHLVGDAEGAFLARVARDGGPEATTVTLTSPGATPPEGAQWEQTAFGDATFLVSDASELRLEWRDGEAPVACLVVRIEPGDTATRLEAQHVPSACPA